MQWTWNWWFEYVALNADILLAFSGLAFLLLLVALWRPAVAKLACQVGIVIAGLLFAVVAIYTALVYFALI